MLTIQICVGSSCFMRGAPEVIGRLQELVSRHELSRRVVLKGSFCMEECTKGVTVRVGDAVHTGIKPEDVDGLFEREILAKVRG